MLRKSITKGNPRNILYRDYKIVDQKKFEDQLRYQLASIKTVNYSQFHEIFLKTLHAIAPIKKKILRFNHNPFMSKALRKAIMVRSKLKNKYNKNRTEENWDGHKKQRNFCVNLLRKTEKNYFSNLNIKNINDNEAFWKTIKPSFSNKGLHGSSLILSEKNKITNDQNIPNMNNYFTGITSHLYLKPDQINQSENLTNIIENLKNHESMQRIKLANVRHRQTFNFRYVSVKEVKRN